MNRPLAAVLLALFAAQAAAQTIDDPTRPPPGAMLPGSVEVAGSQAASTQLQSILTSREPGGRRIAIINGVTVRQGGKVGDAVLERVGDNEVVLRRGKTLETLKLFPKPPAATAGQGATVQH